MIHLLLILHNMLPAKVGLGAGKFMAAGIPGKAGLFGHHLTLAQTTAPLKGTASLAHQTAQSTSHFGHQMYRTGKGMGMIAAKGLKGPMKFFETHGFNTTFQVFEAGALILATADIVASKAGR